MSQLSLKGWLRSGSPWIWLNAAAVAMSLIAVIGLLGIIAVYGLGYFWPGQVASFEYKENGHTTQVIGEIHEREEVAISRLIEAGYALTDDGGNANRFLIRKGNRQQGADFGWVIEPYMSAVTYPENAAVVERYEWGNAYGFISGIKREGKAVPSTDLQEDLKPLLEKAEHLKAKIDAIEKDSLHSINYQLERLRLQERKWLLSKALTAERQEALASERSDLNAQMSGFDQTLSELRGRQGLDVLVLKLSSGQEIDVPLSVVVRVYYPNQLGVLGKFGFYFTKVWEFLSEDPREANTEGGIFPAIFGTVMMVILMSIFVTPFGVIAAVYLREYSKQGPLTRVIRIAVNNLAGVPSIVYGVFGLGFFVYFLGGSIDSLFFPESYPSPVFGTPGILWASLTLAILTVPVVIVATEEGLSRVPISVREGSLALGATKAETLWNVILPMSSPAMMTGLILAVARAAGEVAPLMLVGVVKLAPTLPLDGDLPFLHLDRKFMHLGFHIYDVGFQSPNVEAARPLVFATAFLLVLVIVILNLASITIRNNLREKYRSIGS